VPERRHPPDQHPQVPAGKNLLTGDAAYTPREHADIVHD
jgi:hypothetical protein